ncbi:MAG: hypothetical protein SFV54_03390 [Bryobacteraceae bacterium]|nr:hypothetical protein [Bryobacteraceae bacterium]
MKRIATLLTVSLGLIAGTSVLQAAAVKASIPFAFEVDGRELPAGDYKVLITHEAGTKITIQNTSQPKAVSFVMQSAAEERESCACLKFYVFDGSRKVLSQVGVAGGVPNRLLFSGERAKRTHSAPLQVAVIPLIAAE